MSLNFIQNPLDLTEDDVKNISGYLLQRSKHDKANRINIDNLDTAHRDIFIQAVNNVLATDLAIFTYAQIIDGLPTADVGWDRNIQDLLGAHPLDSHEDLCPGAMDKARELCQKWDPLILLFNPKIL